MLEGSSGSEFLESGCETTFLGEFGCDNLLLGDNLRDLGVVEREWGEKSVVVEVVEVEFEPVSCPNLR